MLPGLPESLFQAFENNASGFLELWCKLIQAVKESNIQVGVMELKLYSGIEGCCAEKGNAGSAGYN